MDGEVFVARPQVTRTTRHAHRDHLRVFTLTTLKVELTVSNLWAVMSDEPQEKGLGSCDNTGQGHRGRKCRHVTVSKLLF